MFTTKAPLFTCLYLFVHIEYKHVIQIHNRVQVMTNLFRCTKLQYSRAEKRRRNMCIKNILVMLRGILFRKQWQIKKMNVLYFSFWYFCSWSTLGSFPLPGSFIITIITLWNPAKFTGTVTLLWLNYFSHSQSVSDYICVPASAEKKHNAWQPLGAFVVFFFFMLSNSIWHFFYTSIKQVTDCRIIWWFLKWFKCDSAPLPARVSWDWLQLLYKRDTWAAWIMDGWIDKVQGRGHMVSVTWSLVQWSDSDLMPV